MGSIEGNQGSCFNIFESDGTADEFITPEIILLQFGMRSKFFLDAQRMIRVAHVELRWTKVKLVLWPNIHLIFILCILILCVRKMQFYRNEKGYAASELQFVKQSREIRTKPLTRLNLISMVGLLLYHVYSTSYSLLILVLFLLN